MAEPKRTLRLLNQESLPRLTGRCGRASWRLGPCRALHRVSEGWPPEATQGDYSVRGKRTDSFRIPDWAIEQPSKYGINSPGLHETFSAHDCPWPFAAPLTSLRYSSI